MQTPKSKVAYIKISADYADQRIDNFLLARLKGMPKSHIYRLLRKGEVRVNKKRIDPNYRLQEEDEVRLPPMRLDEKAPLPRPHDRQMDLLQERIIFENQQLLVINKPAGIPVHGGSKTPLGIIEILRVIFPNLSHLELVHRLDADTSGCLILAKKRSILRQIHELMRNGSIRKIYHALTLGHWKTTELKVNAPLKKNILSSGERMVRVNEEGKESITHFKVLKDFSDCSLVEARLLTGRTHQIRVHAQYRKHPIASDEKYGDKEFNKNIRAKGLKRLFLHAKEISFTLPTTGEKFHFEAPLDDDLNRILETLK